MITQTSEMKLRAELRTRSTSELQRIALNLELPETAKMAEEILFERGKLKH